MIFFRIPKLHSLARFHNSSENAMISLSILSNYRITTGADDKEEEKLWGFLVDFLKKWNK